jgi:CYTH domain-containing protein
LVASRGVSLRIRKSQQGKVSGGVFTETSSPCYTTTFKCNGGSRVVEIEKKIDERDFTDLWPLCLNKLEKYRYVLKDQELNTWEIDFFKDHHNDTYFAMAELEMPEGQISPNIIPEFISNNLIYEVPLTDCRFSSKLLGDVRYAINLHKSLTKGTKHV